MPLRHVQGSAMIPVASTWAVRDRLDRETCRRAGVEPEVVLVTVTKVQAGKHNIDKGPTATPPDDEVHFYFNDSGRTSVCGEGAFLRSYVPQPVAPDATVPPE